jgi:hypothetical protein
VHMLRVVVRVTDHPRAWRDLGARPITRHRRRLMSCRTVRIPDAAFTGWWIVPFGDVEPSVAVPLEVRVTVVPSIVDRFRTAQLGRVPSPSLTRSVLARTLVPLSSRRWQHPVREDSSTS